MEFIQSIVDGNRLIYETPKQEVMKQSPREAFETIGKFGDFSWLDNFDFSQITEDQIKAINNITKKHTNTFFIYCPPIETAKYLIPPL